VAKDIVAICEANFKIWRYQSCYLCPQDFPRDSLEDQKKLHGIVLFYQKIPYVPPSSAEASLVLYTKQITETVAIALVSHEGERYFLRQDASGAEKVISLVEIDVDYKTMDPFALNAYLEQTTFRLAPLSDGSYKLYICGVVKGGMMPGSTRVLCENLGIGDPNVEDTVVADRILAVLPQGTYSSISVQTQNYQFPGTAQAKPTRVIHVKVTYWEWAVRIFQALADQPIQRINENRAVQGILGSTQPPDTLATQKAYKKMYEFEIRVSVDLESFNFEPKASRAVAATEGRCAIL
jgi:hypothetical protein